MGTVRSPLKEKAMQMRLQGRSYNDILKRLNMTSKGTLSFWLRGLPLSPEAQERLRKNSERASKLNLEKFNRARSERIKMENRDSFEKGREKISSLSIRELMLVGVALYWGEGTKSDNNGKWQSLSFANSDPAMVSVYLLFIRKILNVPESKIYGGVHLYPSTDVDKALKYWTRITKLPRDRFYVTKMVSHLSAGKRNPRLLPHGTITLRVHTRRLFHEMKGMISGLFEAEIKA